MCNFWRYTKFDGHNIKADVTVPVGGEDVFFCCFKNPPRLLGRDKFFRLTIGKRRPCLYLHKNGPVVPAGNQVNFASFEPVISGNDFKSLFSQEISGQGFSPVTCFDFIAHNYILPLIIEFTIMSSTKKYIESFTRQLSDALKIGQSLDLERPGSDIRNIVIAGMGSSGISANLVESLTFGRIPIPITVCKSYNIPQFVSPHTLFIACSYSGDAEETVAALNKALLNYLPGPIVPAPC
jgi:hypothetical protein